MMVFNLRMDEALIPTRGIRMNTRISISTAFIMAVTTQSAFAETFAIDGTAGSKLNANVIASFSEPWAMTFLPDNSLLVTEKAGKLFHVMQDGKKTEIRNVPKVSYGGQGGMGDVVLHPDFSTNKQVYLSFIESLDNGKTRGAIVVRAQLDLTDSPKLKNVQRVWTQAPKMRPGGHFSHRIAFGPKGTKHDGKLFITSGDRQLQTPAQDWNMALGKVIRLNGDGSVPPDNPWQNKGELAKSFWTTGHRNLLGIDFDKNGNLWTHEMGPAHGDELNLIKLGQNYGWPVVSNGNNYSGKKIPNHDTRPEFAAPKAYWVPSIAPSGLVIYKSGMFPNWQGNAFIGGLRSRALIRVKLNGENATEAERFEWNKRIREVEQGPKGALWVLEDRKGGRLLKLTQ